MKTPNLSMFISQILFETSKLMQNFYISNLEMNQG